MPSPQTPKAPDKVLVKPGEGRKVPLRIPGTTIAVPAEGVRVVQTRAVTRLLGTGDLKLVEGGAPEKAPPSPPAPAAAKSDAKEG